MASYVVAFDEDESRMLEASAAHDYVTVQRRLRDIKMSILSSIALALTNPEEFDRITGDFLAHESMGSLMERLHRDYKEHPDG